jgi:site-specific recombinase XerD
MPATIASIVNEFLARQNLAESTRRCYQSALKPFTQKYGNYLANELSQDQLESYLQQLSPRVSYATHNRHQATLSALFAFAVERRYRRDNPLNGIKYLKPRQSKKEHSAESPIHFLRPDQLTLLYQLLKARASQPRFYRLLATAQLSLSPATPNQGKCRG